MLAAQPLDGFRADEAGLMSRTVNWKGKSDDSKVPDSVKERILRTQGNRCLHCTREFGGPVKPEFDHRVELDNGGNNWESNLDALCATCHKRKTADAVAPRAKARRIAKKNAPGAKPSGRGWSKPAKKTSKLQWNWRLTDDDPS